MLLDGMRMVQRKQDALSSNFLLEMIDDAEKNNEIKMDVRKAPRIKSDQTLSHLSNRIVDEVRVTTPRQRAKNVLKTAGISTSQSPESHTVNSHLRHVGQRARKIPLNQPERKIRRVKKQPVPATRRRPTRGPPPATRHRPAVGMEDEVRRSARDENNQRGKRRRRTRKFLR